jgi:hypothetical protein
MLLESIDGHIELEHYLLAMQKAKSACWRLTSSDASLIVFGSSFPIIWGAGVASSGRFAHVVRFDERVSPLAITLLDLLNLRACILIISIAL